MLRELGATQLAGLYASSHLCFGNPGEWQARWTGRGVASKLLVPEVLHIPRLHSQRPAAVVCRSAILRLQQRLRSV